MDYYIIIIVVVIALAVCVGFYLYYDKREEKLYDELSLEYEKQAEEEVAKILEGQELLIAQIQPHFIYNVLNTLKYLCRHNPEEAMIAIDRFSAFLRESMDAFAETECIPFEKELDIVENYIYLEKRRFGDRLEVIYDLSCTDFTLPALSLQPMVENAVKHGITKKLGGGTIWISTRQTEEGFEVEIKDNGEGFYVDAPASAPDGKSHIGIKNTRHRIKSMCNGSLHIESDAATFTRVLITIPKDESREASDNE